MAQPMLFEPISIRDVTLKNRVVVAPMHQYSAVKGYATDWHLMNAGRFAAGGAGLVIMESTKVERRGCGTVGDLGLWQEGHSTAWLRDLVWSTAKQIDRACTLCGCACAGALGSPVSAWLSKPMTYSVPVSGSSPSEP